MTYIRVTPLRNRPVRQRKRIFDAIEEAEITDGDLIFEALKQQLVFRMAMVCPDCRRNIARKLKAEIPVMLASAAQFAASHGNTPTCH
jgi:uncharacterized protein YbaR (Trm112 family)